MENWLIVTGGILLKSLVSILAIFSIIIVITRVAGLRTFAKMTSFDFASTIALGTILASVIMNVEQSLLKGAVAMAGIVAFQFLFSLMIRKSNKLQKILTNSPKLLMRNGEILYENLASTNVSESDLIGKLREANVIELSEVKAVVLETTGDISVLHTSEEKDLEDFLLKGVKE
ncbi:MAG: DUF421 domain-containing protein [Flavobacteriaceae bacterium]|nr:DUF421 domain-containing protein [Flavobacteriaceae bacterium]